VPLKDCNFQAAAEAPARSALAANLALWVGFSHAPLVNAPFHEWRAGGKPERSQWYKGLLLEK